MKIFVSCKVPRGHPERTELAQAVSRSIQNTGHVVFLAYWEIEQRGITDPRRFMPLVREHIHCSDLVILIYEAELRGGLIEAGIAYAAGVPIWLVHRYGEPVSSSILGCVSMVIEYRNKQELIRQLDSRLRNY